MAFEHARPHSESVGPVTLVDSAVSDAPSDDGVVPKLPSSLLKSHTRFPFIDSDADENRAKDNGATSVIPARHKRPGGEPIAPAPQRPCAELETVLRVGDEAIRTRRQKPRGATEKLIYIIAAGIGRDWRYPL